MVPHKIVHGSRTGQNFLEVPLSAGEVTTSLYNNSSVARDSRNSQIPSSFYRGKFPEMLSKLPKVTKLGKHKGQNKNSGLFDSESNVLLTATKKRCKTKERKSQQCS